MPIRLVITIGTMVGIIALLESAQPEDNSVLLPIIVLCTMVPAYWTSRRIIEIDEKDLHVTDFWWIMGSKFRQRSLGTVQSIIVKPLPEDYISIRLVLEHEALTVVRSIAIEKASDVLGRFEAIGLTIEQQKNPESKDPG
ncbi:MAG: hypothetical protein AAGA85_08420 [Bacteroidota bacterium]